jgi:hypothetical protein
VGARRAVVSPMCAIMCITLCAFMCVLSWIMCSCLWDCVRARTCVDQNENRNLISAATESKLSFPQCSGAVGVEGNDGSNHRVSSSRLFATPHLRVRSALSRVDTMASHSQASVASAQVGNTECTRPSLHGSLKITVWGAYTVY